MSFNSLIPHIGPIWRLRRKERIHLKLKSLLLLGSLRKKKKKQKKKQNDTIVQTEENWSFSETYRSWFRFLAGKHALSFVRQRQTFANAPNNYRERSYHYTSLYSATRDERIFSNVLHCLTSLSCWNSSSARFYSSRCRAELKKRKKERKREREKEKKENRAEDKARS